MDYSPRLLRHSHLTTHTRYPEGIHVNHPSSTHPVLRLRRVQGTRSRPADFHSPRNSRRLRLHRACMPLQLPSPHQRRNPPRLLPAARTRIPPPPGTQRILGSTRRRLPRTRRRRPRPLSARVLQRNPSRRTQLPLERAAFSCAPAGPLHRADHEDPRTHHRHRIHQRGTPRRRHDPAEVEPHLHRTRRCRPQPRTPRTAVP